jgi:hypothetical protein
MRFILRILIRMYVNKYCNREITKLRPEEEMELYKFKSAANVHRIIKSNITVQTLKHFEAKTEQERWMIKGASLALQILKDKHLYALKLEKVKSKKERIKMWTNLNKY